MTTNKTRQLTLGALMIAVTAICAQIMLPLGPVQFSLQVFAVFLAAALLPPAAATSSMLAYLLLGTFGAPVFGGFRGGPSVLFGVTGGFILAFPLMALAISLLRTRLGVTKPLPLMGLMTLSLVICYGVGCGWFSLVSGATLGKAAAVAVYPFILPDLLKAAAAAWLSPLLLRRLASR